MTSLADRPNTALVVIDMQRNVVGQAHDVDRVVANINTLVDKARTERVSVIWVQHSDEDMPQGSEGWQYIPELTRHDDEPLVHKRYGDSFEETDLESLLSERGVGRLVVTGAQTDACIRSTLHGALVRGYDTTLVEDAHTQPKTCANGDHRSGPIRPLPTRTCTGSFRQRPVAMVALSRRPRSISQVRDAALRIGLVAEAVVEGLIDLVDLFAFLADRVFAWIT